MYFVVFVFFRLNISLCALLHQCKGVETTCGQGESIGCVSATSSSAHMRAGNCAVTVNPKYTEVYASAPPCYHSYAQLATRIGKRNASIEQNKTLLHTRHRTVMRNQPVARPARLIYPL